VVTGGTAARRGKSLILYIYRLVIIDDGRQHKGTVVAFNGRQQQQHQRTRVVSVLHLRDEVVRLDSPRRLLHPPGGAALQAVRHVVPQRTREQLRILGNQRHLETGGGSTRFSGAGGGGGGGGRRRGRGGRDGGGGG